MTQRFAIYFAPLPTSLLGQAAAGWLGRADMQDLTVSARRYGFHATLKAPMVLADGADATGLEAALADFAGQRAPLALTGLAPRLIEGFVALTTAPQPAALSALAADIVTHFDRFRAPLTAAARARRLEARLTARQVELLDHYGYPYVLEQFQFHMTLSDRLEGAQRDRMLAAAEAWFAPALAEPVWLDRLVLFEEAIAGADFVPRCAFELTGKA